MRKAGEGLFVGDLYSILKIVYLRLSFSLRSWIELLPLHFTKNRMLNSKLKVRGICRELLFSIFRVQIDITRHLVDLWKHIWKYLCKKRKKEGKSKRERKKESFLVRRGRNLHSRDERNAAIHEAWFFSRNTRDVWNDTRARYNLKLSAISWCGNWGVGRNVETFHHWMLSVI